MVLVFLGPADEQAAVAVQPGVARFDDPAPGAPAGGADLLSDLLAARTDVRRQLVVADQLADLGVVVGLVQADALRRSGVGLGSLDRDRVQRALQELVIVAVRAVVIEPDRDPRALAEDRAFRPLLALSVGFGPVFGPPNGALVIAPSAASNAQSMPTSSSYSSSPWRQISWNTPACSPLLKAPMRRTRRTDPRRVQRVPLHPGAQHQQDRVHRVAIRHPRVVATQRVKRRSRQQRLDPLPQPVRHPPTIIPTHHVAHHDLLIEWHKAGRSEDSTRST